MQISRRSITNLFNALGYSSAVHWRRSKIQEKIRSNLAKFDLDEAKYCLDRFQYNLLMDVQAAIERKEPIEIHD